MATEQAAIEELPSATVVPDAVSVARIRVSDEELTRRTGLSWAAVEEELGPAAVAVVRVAPDGPTFVLVAYFATDGVSVLGSAKSTSDDLDRLLSALHVRDDEVEDRAGAIRDDAKLRDEERLLVEFADLRRRVEDVAKDPSALQARRRDPEARTVVTSNIGKSKLTRAQREALLLYDAGLSYDEIATRLGVSESAVSQRLARARRAVLGP